MCYIRHGSDSFTIIDRDPCEDNAQRIITELLSTHTPAFLVRRDDGLIGDGSPGESTWRIEDEVEVA